MTPHGRRYREEFLTAGADGAEIGTSPGLMLRAVAESLFALFPLPQTGSLLIGRSEQADLRIDHASISRRHAMLHVGPQICIEDLGSANGTRVGQHQLGEGERVPLAIGAVADLGSVMIVVQPTAVTTRPRRPSSHDDFARRLEKEVARARATRGAFAVARLNVEGPASASAVEEALVAGVRSTDLLAAHGPGEYELLLVDTAPEAAGRALEALSAELGRRGATVRTGLGIFPRDGTTADALLVAAGRNAGRGANEVVPVLVEHGAVHQLDRIVDRIAAGTISVLLIGETGVGKELMAERIHHRSPRAAGPLLRLNCAALSESLLESELFGHERGAFTGAVQAKLGLLETAHGGTVFLDEVGELPLSLQVKLLRVLEEHQILPVGALTTRPIDVRFIAATNRDPEAEIAAGRLRQDLYFRLNGITLLIPPLRDRVSEIEPLAREFAARAASQLGRVAPRLSPEALDLLERYTWPGNVRELRNVMERAVLLCDAALIGPQHLPIERMRSASIEPPPDDAVLDADRERERILSALAQCAGNQTQAAQLLGISRGTLVARLEAYGVPRPRKPRASR